VSAAEGITAAPNVEALLSTVDAAGAALVAALEACVAAGLPVGSIDEARRVARTDGARAWLVEQARPKGPMVTITRPRGYQPPTTQGEVERITDASIILRDGARYSRSDGYRVGGYEDKWNRSRIAMDEIARIVATGWKAPKAAKKVSAK